MSQATGSDLAKVERVSGRAVPVDGDDIDTDRIIPARFMKGITFEGLEKHVFEDVRIGPGGQSLGHPFDDPRYQGARVLVVDRNFGCGSSREHAPQSLQRWGIQALVGESFAEIFFGNCTTLGIPCVIASEADIKALSDAVNADPTLEVTVDVANDQVRYGDKSFHATTAKTAKEALVSGHWDPIGELLEAKDDVASKMKELGWAA